MKRWGRPGGTLSQTSGGNCSPIQPTSFRREQKQTTGRSGYKTTLVQAVVPPLSERMRAEALADRCDVGPEHPDRAEVIKMFLGGSTLAAVKNYLEGP